MADSSAKSTAEGSGAAEGGQSSRPEDQRTPGPQERMSLTTLDKMRRFFFSKDEWEAYLLERLEEEKQKKERKRRKQEAKGQSSAKSS